MWRKCYCVERQRRQRYKGNVENVGWQQALLFGFEFAEACF